MEFKKIKEFYNRICCLTTGCLFILNIGCAPVITSRAVDNEGKKAALDSLQHVLSRQADCSSFIDSQMVVFFDSFLRSGTLAGYLQAKSPGQFRFVGLGPLEQPVLFLSSDGKYFQLIVVPEGKAYLGNTSGKTFAKYSPPGMQPESLFYWFIGGMEPGSFEVYNVRAEQDGNGFWFDIVGSQEKSIHKILIDQELNRIVRHLLIDQEGKIAMDVSYQWPSFSPCCLPSFLTIESPEHSLDLKLSFSECLTNAKTNKVNLNPSIPPFYKKIRVQ